MWDASIAGGRDVDADGSVTEAVTIQRRTYAQPCWGCHNASQVHEREPVERLLAETRTPWSADPALPPDVS